MSQIPRYAHLWYGELLVVTDARDLVFLFKSGNDAICNRTTGKRLMRTMLAIQSLPLTFMHIAGESNLLADTLSRSAVSPSAYPVLRDEQSEEYRRERAEQRQLALLVQDRELARSHPRVALLTLAVPDATAELAPGEMDVARVPEAEILPAKLLPIEDWPQPAEIVRAQKQFLADPQDAAAIGVGREGCRTAGGLAGCGK